MVPGWRRKASAAPGPRSDPRADPGYAATVPPAPPRIRVRTAVVDATLTLDRLAAAAEPTSDLTGLGGWVADVLSALGLVGVFVLTTLETLFPPIPSEVILPLSGYLASQGEMSLVGAIMAATLGSVAGALALYEAGARLGIVRIGRSGRSAPADRFRGRRSGPRSGSTAMVGLRCSSVASFRASAAWCRSRPGTGAMSRTAVPALHRSRQPDVEHAVRGRSVGDSARRGHRSADYSHWFDRLVIAVVVLATIRLVVTPRLNDLDRRSPGPGRARPTVPRLTLTHAVCDRFDVPSAVPASPADSLSGIRDKVASRSIGLL